MTEQPKAEGAEIFADDLRLARAVLAKDRKATAELVRLHADVVYRFVWRRLMPRESEIEDLVQETFLAAWRGLASYSGTSPIEAWLISIARHKVEDFYRRVLREAARDEDADAAELPFAAPPVDEILDQERLSARAEEALAGMRYDYASILRWRYWEQRSGREIAAATGRSEKAVERMLARAREHFRRAWSAGEGGQDGAA